jgi:O-succinylbenzoate synthase
VIVSVEQDDGQVTVYQYVTDVYIALRQEEPAQRDGLLTIITKVSSSSWGANVRELVKEVQQSLVELQDFLKGRRDGTRSG